MLEGDPNQRGKNHIQQRDRCHSTVRDIKPGLSWSIHSAIKAVKPILASKRIDSKAAARGASSSRFLVYLSDIGAPGAAASSKKAVAKSDNMGKTMVNVSPSNGIKIKLALRPDRVVGCHEAKVEALAR
jgi:hypothetical protein